MCGDVLVVTFTLMATLFPSVPSSADSSKIGVSASLIASMSLVYAVELKLPHLLNSVVTEVLQLTECELVSLSLSVCMSTAVMVYMIATMCLVWFPLLPTSLFRNRFKSITVRERNSCCLLWVGLQALQWHPPRQQSSMAVPLSRVHPWKWSQHLLTQKTLRTCLAFMMG